MKRTRLALLGIVTISLLMNLPDWFSGWNDSIVTNRVSARPLFVPDVATHFAITAEGSEGNDAISWSEGNPSNILSRRSINGLQPGESITALEGIPPPNGLNTIAEDEPAPIISAITNQGRLYNIDCETANAVFVALIQLLQENQRLSYTFNPDTGVGLVLDPEDGMQLAFNPYTGQVLGTGPINFFYAPGDANAGKTPNVFAWEVGLTDYDLDGDTDIFSYDETQNTLGEIGGDGSLNTLFPLNLPDGATFVAMDSPGVTFGDINNGGDHDLYVLVQGANDPPAQTFFGVDLNTGQMTDFGPIGDGTDVIVDFDVVKQPPLVSCGFDAPPLRPALDQASVAVNYRLHSLDDAQPVSDVDVQFEVISGPNQGVSGTSKTDENGEAAFQYNGNGQVGTDTVEARVGSVSCTTTVDWTDLLIETIKTHTGGNGKHVCLEGAFRRGDEVRINDETIKKVKYKKCGDNGVCSKIVAKKGVNKINTCPDGIPLENTILLFRDTSGSFYLDEFVSCR